jgi:glycosyltransferase involved in cell wall biosynthesis
VQALEKITGIRVTGEVEDVRPYLARAWAFVAPLRVTMGVPTKILEAMAAQVPTVASRAGVRGLADGGIQSGRDLLVAEDDGELRESIERLLEQRHLRERIGASGRRLVCRSYSWEQTAQRLERALVEIRRPRPPALELIRSPREAGVA